MLFEYVEKNEVEWQICKSLIEFPSAEEHLLSSIN